MKLSKFTITHGQHGSITNCFETEFLMMQKSTYYFVTHVQRVITETVKCSYNAILVRERQLEVINLCMV